jgi:hypothetical protein
VCYSLGAPTHSQLALSEQICQIFAHVRCRVFSFPLIHGGRCNQFSPQMSTEIHFIGTLTLSTDFDAATNCPGFISAGSAYLFPCYSQNRCNTPRKRQRLNEKCEVRGIIIDLFGLPMRPLPNRCGSCIAALHSQPNRR